jgi:hypothetical protein
MRRFSVSLLGLLLSTISPIFILLNVTPFYLTPSISVLVLIFEFMAGDADDEILYRDCVSVD